MCPVGPVETANVQDTTGAPCVVAADVGGSSMKLAYATTDARLHEWRSVPVGELQARGVVAGIVEELRHAVEAAPGSLRPRGIGLVVPGILDEAAGVGRLALLLGWRNAPFRQLVTEATGLPLDFGHDVGAGATAEGRLGAGRGHRDWIFLALGTGLGSAFVLGGKPYRGWDGFGGELAHVVARPDGPLCRCGKHGCLEMLASGSAISARYTEAAGASAAVTAAVCTPARSWTTA